MIVLTAVAVALVWLSPVVGFSVGKADAQVAAEEKPVDDFIYNPAGRRDPFVPLVKDLRKESLKPRKNLGPLEKYELSQFRLLAMMIVKGTPWAMVKAPDGKSYTVKPGDLIGPRGGRVKRIETKVIAIDEATGQRILKSPDRIVVEEPVVDNYSGKVTTKDSFIVM